MKVLVTGGAGYIGSTIASALEESGHIPIVFDSLISGMKEFTKGRIFYEGDIADFKILQQIIYENPEISCVIHCAAYIVVSESVEFPYRYYYNNFVKSLEFLKNLDTLGIHNVVFSSSASIYDGTPDFMVFENSPLNPMSPYARSKYMMELALNDLCSVTSLRGLSLRYFNPIGADPKFRSGSYIKNPSHLLGSLVDVALRRREIFQITGVKWKTRDGSGIRDYIHVWDLAAAHVTAVERFDSVLDGLNSNSGVLNIGSGKGITVKEFVSAFERVWGSQIPKVELPARPGDIVGAFANVDRANYHLGWNAKLSIEDGILTALAWNKRFDNKE
jgi:UDP-glucose 4-epimerase